MKYKKFISQFLAFSTILILLNHLLIYILDPLFFYRTPTLYEPQYVAAERYQMPGLIKNREYETLIAGTSMTRNFVESDVDEAFTTTSFNAALPSATVYEQNQVVKLSLATHDLKRVIWELNPAFFEKGIKATLKPEDNLFPAYLYDINGLNDLKYSLSSYTYEMFIENIKANRRDDPSHRVVERLYKFGKGVEPQTVEEMLEQVKTATPRELTEHQSVDHMIRSFNYNVLEVVKNNPDVEFVFFYPPNPITYHLRYDRFNPKITENRMEFKKYVMNSLSKYNNVKLYDFQAKRDLTFAMNKYMDVVHYYPETNAWMAEVMADPNPSVWQDATLQMDRLYRQIKNFKSSQLTD